MRQTGTEPGALPVGTPTVLVTVQEAQASVRRWGDVAGAWAGIGTAPGALLLGAGLVMRHGGAVPLLSIFCGLALIAAVVWVQGQLGLRPPLGEGSNLTQLAAAYFTPAMARILAAAIAIGMTGWYGVNVGMGASALAALASPLGLPRWGAALILGVPIAALAMRGIHGWIRLATVTTVCVLGLVLLVLFRYRDGALLLAPVSDPASGAAAAAAAIAGDMAVMLGYVGVFSLRTPDFTAGLKSRRDLSILTLLLVAPLAIVVFAGGVLGQRSGSADLIAVLAGPQGLAIGNLLIALAVIAPTFTTFYSGTPAWRTAVGIGERPAMLIHAVVGLTLAAAHFDALLLPWLGVLGAVLPPVVVPLVVEFALRRRGRAPRSVPAWPWLAGAIVAGALALAHHPLAMVMGFLVTGVATGAWVARTSR